MKKDILKIGSDFFKSRLIVGTGKYKNFKETAQAVKASGANTFLILQGAIALMSLLEL